MENKSIRIYISHPIRGNKKDATEEDMINNNNKAIAIASMLKSEYPLIDFYCPAEHDEFILIAYLKGYLTERQILIVDCAIIERCDGLIVLDWENGLSRGMRIEAEHCFIHNIPYVMDKCKGGNVDKDNMERLLGLMRKRN